MVDINFFERQGKDGCAIAGHIGGLAGMQWFLLQPVPIFLVLRTPDSVAVSVATGCPAFLSIQICSLEKSGLTGWQSRTSLG